MDKVTSQCPQTTTFLKKKAAEAVSNRGPTANQPNALPIGQTGSHIIIYELHNVRLMTEVDRVVVVDRSYTALFSALERTHCARM